MRLLLAALTLFCTLGLTVGVADLRGQQAEVHATVLPAPISGAGVRTLRFETVEPGVNKTVLPGEATTSGQFQIQGVKHSPSIDLTFTFPANLRHTVVPSWTIPLDFNGNYAQGCLRRPNGNLVDCATWNPVAQSTFSHNLSATPPGQRSGTYELYIGGQAQPGPNTSAGSYTAQIQLTFVVN